MYSISAPLNLIQQGVESVPCPILDYIHMLQRRMWQPIIIIYDYESVTYFVILHDSAIMFWE